MSGVVVPLPGVDLDSIAAAPRPARARSLADARRVARAWALLDELAHDLESFSATGGRSRITAHVAKFRRQQFDDTIALLRRE